MGPTSQKKKKKRLLVAGTAKFEMCVVIHLLHAEDKPVNWNSIKLVTENSKWDDLSPLSMNWAKLHF